MQIKLWKPTFITNIQVLIERVCDSDYDGSGEEREGK